MSVKHGKNLTIVVGDSTTVADVTNWSLDDSTKPAEYASSATSGENKRVDGIHDSTGSFEILADTLPTGVTKGATVSLTLTSDGTVTPYSKSVLITDVTYTVDVHNLVKANVKFAQA